MALFSSPDLPAASRRASRFESSMTIVALVAVAFMALAGNAALWRTVDSLMPLSIATAGFWLAEAFVLMAVIHLLVALARFRYLFKPVLVLLFFSTAAAAYFMAAYGTLIDSSMIQNAVETDVAEATELLTGRLALYLLLLGVLPSWLLLRTRIRYPTFSRQLLGSLLSVLASVAVAALALASHYKDFSLIGRAHKELRLLMNPVYPIYAVGQYALTGAAMPGVQRVQPIGQDAHRVAGVMRSPRKMLVVFVVGETARAANFSLNGYSRPTNPELAKLPLINFRNTVACGTSTAISVRCMFSNLGREQFSRERADGQEGVLDVLQRAGVTVSWRDNNSGCKGACDRVSHADLDELHIPDICNQEECHDEVLLRDLEQQLAALPADAFLVLHQKGSHGPAYYKRTPAEFKQFLPECTDANVQNCDQSSIVNAYDNTILYTDHILAGVVKLLQRNAARYDSAMIYVSDHGESLGENEIYLHGFPYLMAPAEQKQVPLLMWLSDGIEQRLQLDHRCLARQAEQPASHDNLFHSFLGLFDVRSQVYQRELDLFQHCRSAQAVAGSTGKHANAVAALR